MASSKSGSKIGETAGECTAVWCCCPCAMMHLLVLAVYKLPIGLWKNKKRNRLLNKKKRKQLNNESYRNDCYEETSTGDDSLRVDEEVVEWENEMLDRFYGAGFWRSGSRKSHVEQQEEEE